MIGSSGDIWIVSLISWGFSSSCCLEKQVEYFWWRLNQNYFGLHENKSTNILMKKPIIFALHLYDLRASINIFNTYKGAMSNSSHIQTNKPEKVNWIKW
jgi:hypothetical protein